MDKVEQQISCTPKECGSFFYQEVIHATKWLVVISVCTALAGLLVTLLGDWIISAGISPFPQLSGYGCRFATGFIVLLLFALVISIVACIWISISIDASNFKGTTLQYVTRRCVWLITAVILFGIHYELTVSFSKFLYGDPIMYYPGLDKTPIPRTDIATYFISALTQCIILCCVGLVATLVGAYCSVRWDKYKEKRNKKIF